MAYGVKKSVSAIEGTDFENYVNIFANRVDRVVERVIKYWSSFTGMKVPRSYVVPPIELSDTEKVLHIGVRPNYNFLQRELCKSRLELEAVKVLAPFIAELGDFLQDAAISFDENRFEQIDNAWLDFKRSYGNRDIYGSEVASLQLIMDKLYERPYNFIVCGDYSYNQCKILLYTRNIEKRIREDEKYGQVPAQQVLECILVHELFHSLHFMTLHEACAEHGTTMLKIFNPFCLTDERRNQLRRRRKTVIESLAKYFEYSYARARGFVLYTAYEREGFVGRRKHYPAWPYAGAKVLIENDDDITFLQALNASVDIKHGRGLADAYDVIDNGGRPGAVALADSV